VSDLRSALLLAALQRKGKPMDGDELLDHATGLALNEGWTPNVLGFNRKVVARRLVNMEREGLVKVVAMNRDSVNRRDTPVYEPTGGWDASAFVPGPQGESTRTLQAARTEKTPSSYDAMSPRQLRAILETQDMLLESTSRMIQHLQAGLNDMAQTREKARLRLVAEGLEPR
jgi:hypothetical protein